MSNKNSDYYFLRGGGEMGELIRAKDWSKTSLGDPADWPQSLRTMVAVMLDNPFGMYIAWGNDYTQLYNDGYRPILGATKHPQALGISTRETFSEIWHIIGSMFDGVMKGKAVGFPDLMLPLDRNGFVEECYFDFAYSPIRKDNGEVGGVLVTVIETTNKKKAEEALKESEARFRAIADEAPVFIFLAGENAEVEYLNKTWREYTGISTNDSKGRAWAEITHIDDIEPATKIYMDGFNKRESCSFENRQKGIDGIYRTILWKATPRFSLNGQFIGMMGVGLDIHERKKSEEKLRGSEQKVRALVENAPFPIAVYVGKEMIVELANQSIIDIWGKGNDVIGKSFKEVLPELDSQLVFEQIQNVFETGESFHTKNTPLDLIIDGKPYTYYFNYSFTPLYDINGNIYGVMNTGVDLTELNLAKKRIEESDKRFRETMKQAPICITILRGPQFIVEMANDSYLQLVDKKESEFVGNPLFSSLPEVEETSHPLLDDVLNTGIPFHGNEVPVPLNRYGTLGVFYFDFIYYPLREEDGTISGVIAVATEVTEQVNARKKIEENAEQIKRFKYMADKANDAFILMREDGTFAYLNERALERWGYTAEQATQLRVPDVDPIYNNEVFKAAFEKAQTEKIPPFETLHKRKDGTIYPVEVNMGGLLLNSIPHMFAVARDITERKKSEEKIRESEQRLRLANEASGVAVWEWNVITGQIKWDNEMFKIYGVTPTIDNLVDYTTWSNAVLPEELAQQENILQNTVKSKGQSSRSFSIRRASDGELRHIEAIETVRTNAAGQAELVVGTNLDVTEIVLAQKQLEESQAQLQTVFAQAPAAIALLEGAAHTFGLANSRYQKMTSRSEEQLLGKTMQEVFPELEGTGTIEIFDNVFKTGQTFSMAEYPLMVDINNDGIMLQQYFNFTAEPIKAGGKVASIMVIIYNITEQVVARKKIEASEEKLNIVIEASELGTYELNLKTKQPTYSKKYLEILGGYKEDIQLTHAQLLEHLHPDDFGIREKAFKEAMDTGHLHYEARLIWHDKSIHWMEGKGKVFYDDKNNPEKLIGTIRDITEEKNHEQELQESEERFRNIADSAPVLIWMADTEKLCYFLNKSWLNFTGRTMEQESGNGWTEGVHPDDLQKCMDVYTSSFDNRAPFYREYRLKRHDGEYRWVSDSAVPRFSSAGEFEGYIGACMDITIEKSHQQELEESEKKFRLLADSMAQHIWTSDPEGNLNYYNQSVFDYSGLTLEQINKDGWIQIVHPDDREENIKRWIDSISTGKDFLFEHRFRKHDGEYRWQLSRAIPKKDENGKIQMWVGTSTDINEQKKALEQFKVLADQAPMWVWLTDKEVNILYTNPEVHKFLGIGHYTEFTGQLWEQKVHSEDIAMVYKSFGEAASLQQPFSFEFRVQNAKTLQYEWFHIKAVPRLEDGEFTGFIGTGININEQKTFANELEEKVVTRTAELKASEEKFYNLFNLSPISKTLSDTSSGKIVMVNDAFTKLFGWNRDETLNKSSAELGLLDLEAREIIISELKTNGKIENREIWFIKKSGERFIALASAEVISMGEKQFFLSAFNDISEIKKAEQNIMQKNTELEKMNKELQSFAYISSHDLQEPLRKIQTFATRITEKEKNNLSDSGKEMFNRMQDAAKRMQTLIQDLLAYSRTGTQERKFETTNLNEIIAEVKEDLKEELKEKHATIEANQLCDADIIPFQFRQLMHNLIGNSLKFSNPATPPHIQIKSEIATGLNFNNENLSPQNKYCHITVSDNGIGFEQQYSEKIFEVFQRLHGRNEYNGTGIGLSIVKKIVENHNGIITAYGELNKGATFEIYIPAI